MQQNATKRYVRTLLISTLLLGISLPIQAQSTANSEIEHIMQQGSTAFDRSDIVSAMSWYRKAATLGHAPAQSRLAYLLDQAEENDEALEWYEKAVAQGFAAAEFGLARMHASGEGTERNHEAALALFVRAAEQGYVPAIHVLAHAYEDGQLGLRVDYDQAVAWLRRGVAIEDPWSIKRLARAYRTGELGLRYEPELASELEQRLTPPAQRGGDEP